MMHTATQVFQIDLMHDANARRNDFEFFKRLHPPFEKLIAFGIALKLFVHIEVQCLLRTLIIDHHRMVDYQINGHERLNLFWVKAHGRNGGAHGSQIGQQRYTSEILQHHACDHKGNFLCAWRVGLPIGQLRHVLGANQIAIAMAHDRFEHDANRYR